MQKGRVVVLFVSACLFFSDVSAVFIDGRAGVSYQSQNIVFSNNDTAVGFVKFANGFTVMQDKTLTVSIHPPVLLGIDLRDTGKLALGEDLILESNLTLSTGGVIHGQGFAIILNGNTMVPMNATLSFTSDTIIDGQGHDIELAYLARLYIESNTTLTLRNMRLTNNLNNQTVPPVALKDATSKLALHNVEIACVDDFYFDNGQLFIHDDVVITGSSRFIYKSVNPLRVDYLSNLFMDLGTTFYYDPSSANRDLIIMNDETSRFYFHGATLKSTTTGMRLTKGTLVVDHKSYIESDATSVSEAVAFGDGTAAGDLNIEIMPGGSIWLSSGILDYSNVS